MNIFKSIFFIVLSVQFFYLNGDVLIHAGKLIDVETGKVDSRKSIIIKNKKGNSEIENDFVLAMTGYQPNYNILENLGIGILEDEFKTPFYDEETMETNVKGVFLAGVICGGLKTNKWFIENSRGHSERIIASIRKN